MKKINFILVVLLVFTVPVFIVCLAQNITIKSEEVYSFYFNDSRAVDKLYTGYTSNEMAGIISDFMKSKSPEKFEVNEFNGYDMDSVFSEEDGHNMMCVKNALDLSKKACAGAAILVILIYYWLIKSDKKVALRISYLVSAVMTIAVTAANVWLVVTETGREWVMEKLGMVYLGEMSQLNRILGQDFQMMALIVFAFLSFIMLVAMTYLTLLLTKQVRMFSD